MKEEHVLDEHQASTLTDGREEAIEDSRSHERLEGLGCSTPYGSRNSDDEEPKHNGQASEVCAENDDYAPSVSGRFTTSQAAEADERKRPQDANQKRHQLQA